MRRMALRSFLGVLPPMAIDAIAPDTKARDDVRVRSGRRVQLIAGATVTAVTIESPVLGLVGAAVWAAAALRSPALRPGLPALTAAGSTALTMVVLPRVDRSPARGVAARDRRRVDPRPDGAGLHVVVNAASGSGRAPEVVDELRAELPAAQVTMVEDPEQLESAFVAAAKAARSLGVVGGDGTVNLAARVALEHEVPLAVFPGGTLNHFARDLGLDTVAGTIDAIRDGQVVAIDIGVIADRTFLNNASVGSYSELVDARERLETRLGKWPAMALALVKVLRDGRRLEVQIDGRVRRVWMVFVGNGAYEPSGFAPSDRADLADGLLDVRVIAADRPWSRGRLIIAMMLGTLVRSRVYEQRCAETVTIDVPDGLPTRLAADGETFDGSARIEFGKRRAALLVHVAES